MRNLGTILLAACLAGFASLAGAANTVATCPTATPGTVWAKGAWLPCSANASGPIPLPATAIVADMSTGGCVGTCSTTFSWLLASNVKATDSVWSPSGNVWITAVAANSLATVVTTPPAGPSAQAIVSWSAPTAFTDGTPINVPLTYNVYRGSSATTLTKLTNVTGLSYTDPAGSATPTTYFYGSPRPARVARNQRLPWRDPRPCGARVATRFSGRRRQVSRMAEGRSRRNGAG